jgi:ketosteroid isomerase-like protein
MTTPELIQRYFTCLDREDWEQMRTLWDPAGRMRAVGARERVGREEVLRYFSRLFAPWPSHSDTPTRVVIAESVVTVEVRFDGVTPHGKSVSFEAVDVFDIANGVITALSNWYDIDYARRELADVHSPSDSAGDPL